MGAGRGREVRKGPMRLVAFHKGSWADPRRLATLKPAPIYYHNSVYRRLPTKAGAWPKGEIYGNEFKAKHSPKVVSGAFARWQLGHFWSPNCLSPRAQSSLGKLVGWKRRLVLWGTGVGGRLRSQASSTVELHCSEYDVLLLCSESGCGGGLGRREKTERASGWSTSLIFSGLFG